MRPRKVVAAAAWAAAAVSLTCAPVARQAPRRRLQPLQGDAGGLGEAVRATLADETLVRRIEQDGLAAFVGGFFGVFGTLVIYEKQRFHMKQRLRCAYCDGSGHLTCAACLKQDAAAAATCRCCKGSRTITCINCEGVGLAIPPQLQRKDTKGFDDELEVALDSIGIAALADDIVRSNNPVDPAEVEKLSIMIQRRAETAARLERAKRDADAEPEAPRA